MTKNQATGRQIKAGIIKNEHIAANAAIEETKLSIDWITRGVEILERKLLVDYVQVNEKVVVSSSSTVSLTTEISAPPAKTETEKGAVVEDGKNHVILRNSKTGDPIISTHGTEVYGKLTHDDTNFVLTFFGKTEAGLEEAHTFTEETTIDFQFPQRFSLATIGETFAANEKFVDGASDVSSRLDLEQIIKDVFGSSYDLTQTGEAANVQTIVEQLLQQTSGEVNTDARATAIIDEVIEARGIAATVHERATAIEAAAKALQTDVTEYKAANDARMEAAETAIEAVHKHYAENYKVQAGDPLISTARYDLTTGTFTPGNKSLDVYYNGFLQMEGVHYTEITGGDAEGIAVSFSPDVIEEGEVIQLRWYK